MAASLPEHAVRHNLLEYAELMLFLLVAMKRGAKRIIAFFLLTIATAISFHNFLHMPPVIGMLTGLAYLQFFGY